MGFSLEIMRARKKWDDIFKVLKTKHNCQLRILQPAKISFMKEDKIRPFSDKGA